MEKSKEAIEMIMKDFYSYLKFYSIEDLIKQGRAYLKRSNNIPMAVLLYLTPKEKRAKLELAVA